MSKMCFYVQFNNKNKNLFAQKQTKSLFCYCEMFQDSETYRSDFRINAVISITILDKNP